MGVGAWFYDHKASTDLLPWLPDLPAALNASSATLRVTLRRGSGCNANSGTPRRLAPLAVGAAPGVSSLMMV